LHFAVMQESTEMASFLIVRGANVNVCDNYGITPLSRSAYRGNAEMAQILLEAGAEVNSSCEDGVSALWRAVIEGHNDFAAVLLEHGVNVDVRDEHYDRTELHWAAIKGNKDMVELLLAKGADVKATDNNGRTPLSYALRYCYPDVVEVLTATGGTPGDAIEEKTRAELLKQELAEGDAAVWYTGHVGYTIKTSERLMIFDYWNPGKGVNHPCLANGHIDPAEIAGQNVYVFVTHEHGDHYDTSIFTWENQLPNVKYIYGFRPEDLPQHADSGYNGPEYEYIGPHEQRTIDDMVITTIDANDAGVGFYVEVDGLKIYHAGDHAGWAEGERDGYMAEIDYLAELTSDIDMAFVNVTGCHTHDSLALAEGTYYTLEKLNPKCWFPTHGNSREYVYREFAEKVADQGIPNPAACAENRGDCFVIRNGKIVM